MCRTCGRVEDVACDAVGAIRASLERQTGFQLDEHTVEFSGRRARCASRH